MLGHVESDELADAFGIFMKTEEVFGVFGLCCTTIASADWIDKDQIGLV